MKSAGILCLFLFQTLCGAGQHTQRKIDSLKVLVNRSALDSSKVKALNQLAQTYISIDPDQGVKYSLQAKQHAEEIGWISGIGRAYLILAANYAAQSNYYQSLMSNFGALRIFILQKDVERSRKAMANICRAYQLLSNYPKALEYGYMALGNNPGDVDPHMRAIVYDYISTIHSEKKDFQKALRYGDSSLKLYKQVGDLKGVSGNYSNRAIIYDAQKDYEKAIEYYTYSLKLSEKLNDAPTRQIITANLGLVYLNLHRPLEALEYQAEALSLSIQTRNRMAIAINHGNIGETHQFLANTNPVGRDEHLKQSVYHYEQAIELCRELDLSGPLVLFSKNLTNVYQSLGDHKKALNIYQDHVALRDSVYSVQRDLEFARLDNERDVELKKLDLVIKDRGEEIEYLKEKNERLLLISGIILLLIICIFLYFRLFSKIRSHEKVLTDISQMQSHKVRAPVARILGLADIIKRQQTGDEDNKVIVGHIYNSAQELDLIIREIVGKTLEPGKKSYLFGKDMKSVKR